MKRSFEEFVFRQILIGRSRETRSRNMENRSSCDSLTDLVTLGVDTGSAHDSWRRGDKGWMSSGKRDVSRLIRQHSITCSRVTRHPLDVQTRSYTYEFEKCTFRSMTFTRRFSWHLLQLCVSSDMWIRRVSRESTWHIYRTYRVNL